MEVRLGEDANGPLAGMRVLDFSTVVSGPLCSQNLGDLGAEVIKVEAPAGDTARRMGPPFTAGISPLFAHCNRNKRSIVIDLQNDEGRQVARRLARAADVLIENFRPGVAARLGLAYEVLARENRGLVYVSVNGFGPSVIETSVAGWVIQSGEPQGDPFDAVNSFPGDGRVLIGQFSTANGTSIQGTMYLQYRINGVYENSVGSFQHPPAQPCPWDCGDFDGAVGIVDFLAMLAQWGTPGSCDSDGDGAVGIVDFLALKGHWGPCP